MTATDEQLRDLLYTYQHCRKFAHAGEVGASAVVLIAAVEELLARRETDKVTLPDERLRSMEWARSFLVRLMTPSETKRVPLAVRREARSILKHYPTPFDLERLGSHPLLGGAVRNADEQA